VFDKGDRSDRRFLTYEHHLREGEITDRGVGASRPPCDSHRDFLPDGKIPAVNDLPKDCRVAIIGGGVIGLSIGFHLTKLGITDLVVLEAENLLGTGSSAASAGGLRQQFSEEANILYAMEGVRQIRRLLEETGFDPEFREHGYLLLACSESRLKALTKDVALQNRLGLPSEILTPGEIGDRFPELETGDLTGAAFLETDGYCDPHAILMAFAEGIRKAGGVILTETEATGLLLDGPAVVGVETVRGEVRADVVVNAAGPHGGAVAAWAGLDLPLRPCRRQIFCTHPFPFRRDLPLVIDMDHPFYFRPEGEGVILSAAEVEETRDFDLTLLDADLSDLVERAIHRCPALANATISGGWAGLRTLTPDGTAILGPAPGRPGFLLAVGMSGHGITHGPAVGLALAEWIATGEARSLPLDPFRADRFSPRPPAESPGAIEG
jgi:glycine/D-amino acid oxidase-like deaminating enzyme